MNAPWVGLNGSFLLTFLHSCLKARSSFDRLSRLASRVNLLSVSSGLLFLKVLVCFSSSSDEYVWMFAITGLSSTNSYLPVWIFDVLGLLRPLFDAFFRKSCFEYSFNWVMLGSIFLKFLLAISRVEWGRWVTFTLVFYL